jgi:hypothetical protein
MVPVVGWAEVYGWFLLLGLLDRETCERQASA